MKKIFCLLLATLFLSACAAAEPLPDGLERLVSPQLLPVFRTQRMLQESSYDRTGGNDDGFAGTYSTIRMEGDEHVFFEAEGPGVIYRIWTATYEGVVSVYFDGTDEPAYRARIKDFLGGDVPPLKAPLCEFASGGLCCYFPIAYEKSIKLTLDVKPLFFQVDYAKAENPDTIISATPENLVKKTDLIDKAVKLMDDRGDPFTPADESTDFKFTVQPGAEKAIWSRTRPGVITAIYFDSKDANARDFRNLDLRIYWDGEATPAVDAPLLRFFAIDFTVKKYRSLFVGNEDDRFYSYFPLPFKKARIVVANTSGKEITVSGLVQCIDGEGVPADMGYFHAVGRRMVSAEGEPIVINEVSGGRGHWVGTAVSAFREKGNDDNYLFLEGDEHVFIDGESEPIWSGTGTEDYFNGGWYFTAGDFSRAFYGAPVILKKGSRIAMYRFHDTDAIPFENSIRFEIEHGRTNSEPGVFYDVVGYWYQDAAGKTGL